MAAGFAWERLPQLELHGLPPAHPLDRHWLSPAKPGRAYQVAERVAREGLPQLKALLGRQVQRARQRHRQEVCPGRALAGRDGHVQRVLAPRKRLRLVYRACAGR